VTLSVPIRLVQNVEFTLTFAWGLLARNLPSFHSGKVAVASVTGTQSAYTFCTNRVDVGGGQAPTLTSLVLYKSGTFVVRRPRPGHHACVRVCTMVDIFLIFTHTHKKKRNKEKREEDN
jgi:hypothetical protein